MTIRKEVVGTGITKRNRVTISSPITDDDIKATKKYAEQLSTPLRQIENHIKRILDIAGLPTTRLGFKEIPHEKNPATQSPEWYAKEILYNISRMRASAEHGNIESALNLAADIGLLWKEAEMKFRWEDDVLTRQSHRETRRESGQEGADANRRDSEHNRWRDEDNRIQKARKTKNLQPLKRKSDRAALIKKNLGLSETPQTISKRLD